MKLDSTRLTDTPIPRYSQAFLYRKVISHTSTKFGNMATYISSIGETIITRLIRCFSRARDGGNDFAWQFEYTTSILSQYA